jgi:hypothetical protein
MNTHASSRIQTYDPCIQAKTVHALNHSATVTDGLSLNTDKLSPQLPRISKGLLYV